MTQIHTFKKDQMGWYIDLPSSPFSRGALAMVAGADTFLDIIAQGEDKVTLNLSTDYQSEGWEILERTELHGLGIGGADYIIRNYMNIPYNHKMWLCPVTTWVFGGYYPKTIFFQVF